MNTTRFNTGKYRIPLKLRKHNLKLERYSSGITNNPLNEPIDIEELNDALEIVNDNYDTFKTIFTAPDDINVNREIKQEAAGLLINLFKTNQTNSEPIRLPENKFKPWPKDLTSFIYSSGFDEVEYNKNKGEWKDRNINDFKKLFD